VIQVSGGLYRLTADITNAPATPPWTSMVNVHKTIHATVTQTGVTAGDMIFGLGNVGTLEIGGQLTFGERVSFGRITLKENNFLDFNQTHTSTNRNWDIRYGRETNVGTGSFFSTWYKGNNSASVAMRLDHKTGDLTVNGTIADFKPWINGWSDQDNIDVNEILDFTAVSWNLTRGDTIPGSSPSQNVYDIVSTGLRVLRTGIYQFTWSSVNKLSERPIVVYNVTTRITPIQAHPAGQPGHNQTFTVIQYMQSGAEFRIQRIGGASHPQKGVHFSCVRLG
jgi:hypothetical protein